MNVWVVEVKDFEEEILEGLYTLLNENGINKVKDLINLKNKQIQELTNNWNELEEWLKEQQAFLKDTPTFLGEIYFEHKTMNITYQNVLDKMKEIKEKKYE